MIKCCVFDIGGVIVRNYNVWPELTAYLGLPDKSFRERDGRFKEAIGRHVCGEISENVLWSLYTEITGRTIPDGETGSLLGKFFRPKMDEPTVEVVKQLKAGEMRVVAGTNTVDSHYKSHIKLGQYDLFDKVYASHLMGIAKPNPAFFEYILKAESQQAGSQQAGSLQPQELFFTDDTLENVNVARDVGLEAFHYTNAHLLEDRLISIGALKKNS